MKNLILLTMFAWTSAYCQDRTDEPSLGIINCPDTIYTDTDVPVSHNVCIENNLSGSFPVAVLDSIVEEAIGSSHSLIPLDTVTIHGFDTLCYEFNFYPNGAGGYNVYDICFFNGTTNADTVCCKIVVISRESLSLEEIKDVPIVYPNPVLDKLFIAGNFNEAKVYDISSKLLIETNDNEVDFSGLNSGVYLVVVFENSNIISRFKILKE